MVESRKNFTTMALSRELLWAIRKKKIHPRQSDDEILRKLFESMKK